MWLWQSHATLKGSRPDTQDGLQHLLYIPKFLFEASHYNAIITSFPYYVVYNIINYFVHCITFNILNTALKSMSLAVKYVYSIVKLSQGKRFQRSDSLAIAYAVMCMNWPIAFIHGYICLHSYIDCKIENNNCNCIKCWSATGNHFTSIESLFQHSYLDTLQLLIEQFLCFRPQPGLMVRSIWCTVTGPI